MKDSNNNWVFSWNFHGAFESIELYMHKALLSRCYTFSRSWMVENSNGGMCKILSNFGHFAKFLPTLEITPLYLTIWHTSSNPSEIINSVRLGVKIVKPPCLGLAEVYLTQILLGCAEVIHFKLSVMVQISSHVPNHQLCSKSSVLFQNIYQYLGFLTDLNSNTNYEDLEMGWV